MIKGFRFRVGEFQQYDIWHRFDCPLFKFLALLDGEDNSLRYLCQTQVDSLLAVELPKNEFLLIFSGKESCRDCSEGPVIQSIKFEYV